jgi:hypothetical protein
LEPQMNADERRWRDCGELGHLDWRFCLCQSVLICSFARLRARLARPWRGLQAVGGEGGGGADVDGPGDVDGGVGGFDEGFEVGEVFVGADVAGDEEGSAAGGGFAESDLEEAVVLAEDGCDEFGVLAGEIEVVLLGRGAGEGVADEGEKPDEDGSPDEDGDLCRTVGHAGEKCTPVEARVNSDVLRHPPGVVGDERDVTTSARSKWRLSRM